MKASGVRYMRPSSLDEALEALARAEGSARLLAGGQSLVASLNLRLAETVDLIDISRLEELRGISVSANALRLGALTRHAELERSREVADAAPALAQAAPLIAHGPIRNRGTIGGSLAYADPAAELPACALALEATVIARSLSGSRRISAEGFFEDVFQSSLAEDELIEAVEVPVAGADERQLVLELTRRSGDYAIVGIVLRARVVGGQLSRPRIVFFGVGATPVLAQEAMAVLADGGDLEGARAALARDLDPPTDLHGSGAYRLHLAGVLLGRAFSAATGSGQREAVA
jgi:aerobic carbon-monoxide dehydrogenase medium subunit